MKSISERLLPILKSFGTIALAMSILHLVSFLLAVSLCCVKKTKGKDKVNSDYSMDLLNDHVEFEKTI